MYNVQNVFMKEYPVDIRLKDATLLELQLLAQRESRDIETIIDDAITQYLETYRRKEEHIQSLYQRAKKDHEWLLDELANR